MVIQHANMVWFMGWGCGFVVMATVGLRIKFARTFCSENSLFLLNSKIILTRRCVAICSQILYCRKQLETCPGEKKGRVSLLMMHIVTPLLPQNPSYHNHYVIADNSKGIAKAAREW